MYHHGARDLQDHFDSRRLADRLQERSRMRMDDEDQAFIARMDMLFLATADEQGLPQCSYKGGDPGFVAALDERTLAFPSYDGNGMFLSTGNITVNPHVALLFIDFAGRPPRRLRVLGRATATADDPLLEHHPEAQLMIRVAVDRVFPNCPRYIHRMEPAERAPHVPRPSVPTPPAAWKGADWARDVLPR